VETRDTDLPALVLPYLDARTVVEQVEAKLAVDLERAGAKRRRTRGARRRWMMGERGEIRLCAHEKLVLL
jgi:hypothetical protein